MRKETVPIETVHLDRQSEVEPQQVEGEVRAERVEIESDSEDTPGADDPRRNRPRR